ncbi:MAG: XdhC family protein [Henriciella sp.]|nr:XdhC family protein [Henriciella sp.]
MLAHAPLLDPAQEHAEDVFASALNWSSRGQKVALALVAATEGGAVRAPGAVMAISDTGDAAGYVSGGCIDADVIEQAQRAIRDGELKRLRYGTGSPFVDLRLPCGGAIDVLIWPDPAPDMLRAAQGALRQRRPIELSIGLNGSAMLTDPTHAESGWEGDQFKLRAQPKLRLRVAGKGAELIALTRIAAACNFPISVQSPDPLPELRGLIDQNVKTTTLQTPTTVPANEDDRWTAFVLMFHDTEWETSLLMDALSGPAFFIGAVGSRATQARRREHLRQAGVSDSDINRIHGPIGLVPSLRDASLVAISALAQIIEAQKAQNVA